MTALLRKVRELVGLPSPTLVFTRGGVDHDPAEDRIFTVCGIWILLDDTLNPPQGTPCPACFGDPS